MTNSRRTSRGPAVAKHWSRPARGRTEPPINPLNAELNPICHLLALLAAHHIFHVSGLMVKWVYGAISPAVKRPGREANPLRMCSE